MGPDCWSGPTFAFNPVGLSDIHAVAAGTQALLDELVDARETITALKAELRRWSAEDSEVERLLHRLGV